MHFFDVLLVGESVGFSVRKFSKPQHKVHVVDWVHEG